MQWIGFHLNSITSERLGKAPHRGITQLAKELNEDMKRKLTYSLILITLLTVLYACSLLELDGNKVDLFTDVLRVEADFVVEPKELAAAEIALGEKLRVVATTTMVGDVLSFVGGNEIELTTLMPFNVDPHAFEPTPDDLRALTDAHAIFINGYGLEISLYEILQSVADSVPIISLSTGISELDLESEVGHSVATELLQQDGDPQLVVDPHVWFDPTNVVHWVKRIDRSLSRLDPDSSSKYEEHAETYAIFLNNLDEWIVEQVDQIPSTERILVSDHNVFGYFAQRYGFEYVGAVIPVFSTAADPSAKEIADIEEKISQLGVKVIFIGETFNTALVQTVATDTGVQLVRLYTGALSDPEGPAASYLNYMQYNVAEMVKALSE